MKRFYATVIMFGAVVGYVLLTSFALAGPSNYSIPDDPSIKGKGRDGECMDYAVALSSKLGANGIHGRLIFYRWLIRNRSVTGSHVLVEYRLPNGSEWIVDNEIPHPKRVPIQATPMELVFMLSGDPSAPVDVDLQDGLNQLSYF